MQHPPKSRAIDEASHNKTLAAVVRELYEELPWSRARALVQHGHVSLDGTSIFDPATRVRQGQRLEVKPKSRKMRCAPLEQDRILHVDADIIVVNKPAGIVTAPFKPRSVKERRKKHNQPEQDTLVDRTAMALASRGGHRSQMGRGRHRDLLGIVQRLDKDTTGVLVFARTRAARQGLESQFRSHSITRQYQALTLGTPQDGTIDNVLVPNRGDGRRGSFRKGGKAPSEGRRAITHVQVQETFPNHDAAVTCHLETGRQHQIRIHLAEQGHPLLGEPVYGNPRATVTRASRPMLHAHILGFRHPTRGNMMLFRAEAPDDFQTLADELRHSPPEGHRPGSDIVEPDPS